MEQGLLFDTPKPHTSRKPTGTFLSRNVLLFETFAASATLHKVAKESVRTNARKHGSDRNAAAPFEDAFKTRMEDAWDDIEAETVAGAAASGLTVTSVKMQGGKDKTLADVVLSFEVDGETVSVATNIKRLLPDASHTEGGSILSFLRLALDDRYDPADPPSTRGFDWEQAIVEWLAGVRKIQPGRDYFLLVVHADGNGFHGVEAWPVISGMSGGRPCVHRHTNRAVLEVSRPTETIQPGYDINTELARALLPAAHPGSARALLTSLAIALNPTADVGEVAANLLRLDDWQVGGIASTVGT